MKSPHSHSTALKLKEINLLSQLRDSIIDPIECQVTMIKDTVEAYLG